MRKYKCTKYQKEALSYLKPPEEITVSEWAEKYRKLDSKTSAMPGPWRNSITPYLVGVMDEFNNYGTEEIIFVKPTQVGGTEAMQNMIGYVISQDPSPTIVVYPTETLAESISDKRIQPMINASKILKEKYDKNSPKLELNFDDMFLKLVGSNSASGLASFAMKYLFLDEVDKFAGATRKEADSVSLAEERTKTFIGSKIYKTSTPTLKTGLIWRAKEDADAEKHYFIPCPHCGEYIELKMNNLKWPKEEGMSIADRAEFAHYVCQECGCVITDQEKQQAVKKGHWQIVKQKTQFIRKVAFWINTLYSPFVRFSEIAKKFMESKDDPEKFQNFVNSWLAEPWEDTKLKTSAELVLERQTDLEEFVVPQDAKILTAGVDVQETSLYWTIRAWSNFLTSQNIAHGQAFSFREIENIMNLEYRKPDKTPMIVNLALIDSGNDTDSVYDFCANNSDWALPVKGSSNPLLSHYKISKVNKTDSKAYGMQLVIVDGGKYKDMIAGRMRRKNGRGSWMVYKGCDQEYAEQVTAEHKINVKTGNGTLRQEWVPKTSHADNHYLDAEVYALGAGDVLGIRYMHLEDEPDEPAPREEEQQTPEEKWISENESWVKGR